MTMDVTQLQRKLRDHQAFMFQQGFLDDQFSQLYKLQDETSPNFVIDVVTLFFDDSENLLKNMARAIEQIPVDFQQVYDPVHQYKGSSASVGAARVKNVCTTFRNFCEAKNLEGCVRCLQQLQLEYSQLKKNLQYLLLLQQEIKAAGGSIPKID
ncbi:histidine-containing phosphotransfer protein 3-like isoform X2 [Gastrolobium bilobum]|uniref:histidine-containing phosphotransfer protein 3-like isoform X2 n=1 Tax=Gastrolobium bilobum TaxID=150636 RepID=UPI002AB25B50|nr:histidine-containing phosphotransfer protein 3-like isoform X2 [Gastrolobium bilobum]